MFNFNHLEEVKLNYFQHCTRALRFSVILVFMSFAALIHAIFPFVFHKTVSTLVEGMHKQLKN